MPIYTAIIAEDETNLREYLSDMIKSDCPQIKLVATAKNGPEALDLINKHSPDMAFLDIKMPGLSGMEVAEKIDDSCKIIFTTAYDKYAIEAFDINATDYLLKPIQLDRLKQAITIATNKTNKSTITIASTTLHNQESLQWLKVAKNHQIKMLKISEIDYFQADNKYNSVMHQGQIYLLRMPLKELMLQLDKTKFYQIHRKTIINIEKIDKIIKKTFNMELYLKNNNQAFIVSRTYQYQFKQQ
ncbi:MAG: DNA-binding response regulator [Gammaproteobacteria bacterium]|nr:MAG: DNA-binding response regulator [Gammaproteobacteria bacterium]